MIYNYVVLLYLIFVFGIVGVLLINLKFFIEILSFLDNFYF